MVSEGNTSNFYVITVNYETPRDVVNLVRSLERCDIVKKLIVVDHSSHAFYEPEEASFPIEVIRQANRGYGAGINRGLQSITDTDGIALVCNPDIEIITPETMGEAVRVLQRKPHVACVIPSQIDKASNPIHLCRRFYTWKSLVQSRIGFMRRKPDMYRRMHFYMDRDLDQSFDVDWGGGSSLFFNLRLFPHPLSFDERFFLYFEDVDLCMQAHKNGYSVRYYPRVVIRHQEQRHSQRSLYYLALHIQSLVRFILKYKGLPQANGARTLQLNPQNEETKHLAPVPVSGEILRTAR